jgi:hypothetical protein
MPRFVPVKELFKGRHFDQEIVVLCVRWYLSYKLSSRDLLAMTAERGLESTPVTPSSHRIPFAWSAGGRCHYTAEPARPHTHISTARQSAINEARR